MELDREQEAHQEAVEARAYLDGLEAMATGSSEEQMPITGFQMMMMLRPVQERLERIEKALESV